MPTTRTPQTRSLTLRLALLCLVAWLASPADAAAQRSLRWDRLDVTAHLEADGRLSVVETQTMVFTGDWNGGERTFDIRPRQSISLDGMARERDGVWVPMTRDSSLDDVDDYSSIDDDNRVRWRSRLATDPPFAGQTIRYQLAYTLSGILLKDGDAYRLDHDFAFPDRDGDIARFELHLTFDPAWQTPADVRPVYTAGPIAEGDGFVLTIPLGFSGDAMPSARDARPPSEIGLGVPLILAFTVLSVIWLFAREQWYGRFAPLATGIGEPWLAEHILAHPAEVVAAAWDENVGSAEVVALIGRMVADGKLRSSVGKGKSAKANMTLWLLVDRATLRDHERVLVDKLFIDGSTVTSTSAVRAHYRKTGFHPSAEIEPTLMKAVEQMLPVGRSPWRIPLVAPALCLLGLAMIGRNWLEGHPIAGPLLVPMFILTLVGWATGMQFRAYLQWGPKQALLCLIPAVAIALGSAAYLWFYAAPGHIELPRLTVAGVVLVALGCIHSAVSALKSRRHRTALAFRKRLTAGRAYFIDELRKDQPALRDEWYPWLVAFELTSEMDAWTTAHAPSTSRSRGSGSSSTSSSADSTSASSSGGTWTGFGGGRSGGGGGGASWQAAASGMAAGVSAPSSSSSSGGSSSSSSSSSGGSSGGGGGGGW